ncbi:hypothetical protein QA640_39075 [Bradyrhizobium sp. CB82]|nr:hypothetical protein [Bradyrhizobium sp. CB82]WFU40153.1 hypothetical protein QA640_39075 [Bradyrhizobium sp. CB82]
MSIKVSAAPLVFDSAMLLMKLLQLGRRGGRTAMPHIGDSRDGGNGEDY